MQNLIEQFTELMHPRSCCGESRDMRRMEMAGDDNRPVCCGTGDDDDTVFPSSGSKAYPPETLGPAILVAPTFFDKVRIDEKSLDQADQRRNVKRLLQGFVQAMLRGVYADMVLADGSPIPTICFLDRLLATLELHVESNRQSFPLDDVEAIASWDDVTQLTAGRHRELLRKVRLDDCCVALVLSDGRFVVLRFDSPRTREYFEVCLRILFATREPDAGAMPRSVIETDKQTLSPTNSWQSTGPIAQSRSAPCSESASPISSSKRSSPPAQKRLSSHSDSRPARC